MKQYRAFVLSFEGSAIGLVELSCDDEAEAIKCAKALVEDKPVELWEGARRIARFNPTN
jgi:hypothetical protein